MDKISVEAMYKNMFKDYPEICGVNEICNMLGFGSTKVYQLVQSGKLQKIPHSRTIKVAKATIIDFVLQSAQK